MVPNDIRLGFAKRLEIACDNNDLVPAQHQGRQSWVARQLGEVYNVKATRETVSRWFSGEAYPRPDKMVALSALLQVDEGWLSHGSKDESVFESSKLKNAAVEGPVNLIIGMLSIDGINCAFPESDDPRASDAHFYTILGGKQLGIWASLGVETAEGYRFTASSKTDKVVSLGVVRRGPTDFDVYHLTSKLLTEHGTRRGGHLELETNKMMLVGTERVALVNDFKTLATKQ